MKSAIDLQLAKVLHHLYINPLEKCNLRCKICYTRKTDPILPEATITDFITRYQAVEKIETVTFCGGEVFALDYFPPLMNQLLDQGIFLQVITNGTLDRLDAFVGELEALRAEYLPLGSFLPAVGQGALAVEARKGDRVTQECVTVLNHLPTWQAVTAERAFLHTVEGGCRAPVAALATVDGQILKITAMVADKAGTKIIKKSLEGDARQPESAGVKLAQMMLEAGAASLIDEIRCQ